MDRGRARVQTGRLAVTVGLDGLAIVVVVIIGLVGLAVGSFLNVVIWRVPQRTSLIAPPSACPRCGNAIRPRDNVPVLSWLILQGRCRDCGEPIAIRYPLVELLTGVLFAALALFIGVELPAVAALPAFVYLGAVGVALAFIDVDTHTLPNRIVLPSYAIGVILLTLASIGTADWVALARAAAGAGILFAFYFMLALVVPRGMGFGDVKLAGVLGLYLGYLGWGSLAVGSFAAFVLGGIFSVVLLLARRAGRKSGIPFGPWMILGTGIGIFFGEAIAEGYLALIGLN